MAKTLQVVVSVVARDNVIARSSVRLEGTVDEGKVVCEAKTVEKSNLPYEVKVLRGLADIIDQMTVAGLAGTVMIASSVMPRYLQARKLVDRHNAVDIMTTAWMKKTEHVEDYRSAFKALLASMRRAKNNDILIMVRDVRELYRVKLEGAEGLAGTAVDIRNGISEEYGVRVLGNDRFAGTVKVRESVENGNTVAYGEIIVDSLLGKAKSFNRYGRIAVKKAMSLLPAVVTVEKEKVTVSGNF